MSAVRKDSPNTSMYRTLVIRSYDYISESFAYCMHVIIVEAGTQTAASIFRLLMGIRQPAKP